LPPEVLYYIVPDDDIEKIMQKGIVAPDEYELKFFKDTESIIDLLEKEPDKFRGISLILQIDIKQMTEDGYEIKQDKTGNWVAQKIPSQYISVLK